jgi:hypothetical protein
VLSWLHPPGVAQALQGGQAGDRDGRGLVEGEGRVLAREPVLAGARVLGERPWLMPKTSSPASNLVTACPAATTVPATSSPGTRFLGARKPEPMSRIR